MVFMASNFTCIKGSPWHPECNLLIPMGPICLTFPLSLTIQAKSMKVALPFHTHLHNSHNQHFLSLSPTTFGASPLNLCCGHTPTLCLAFCNRFRVSPGPHPSILRLPPSCDLSKRQIYPFSRVTEILFGLVVILVWFCFGFQ